VDGAVGDLADTPLTFAGDTGSTERRLGDTLEVTGGATGDLTDGNIGVVATDDGLEIKLAKDVDLGPNGSVAIGNTTINNDGLTIVGGPSVTIGGIDAGNTRIINVAPGVDGTDAVNMDQLNEVAEAANRPVTFAGDTGSTERRLGDTLGGQGGATGDLA